MSEATSLSWAFGLVIVLALLWSFMSRKVKLF
jgi:hypothetical protein